MKQSSSKHRPSPAEIPLTTETEGAEDNSASVDSLVDDLAQQDVMPSGIPATILEADLPRQEDATDGSPLGWDEPRPEMGDRIPRVPLEDETKASELLVEEGLDEADEDLREMDESALDEDEDDEL